MVMMPMNPNTALIDEHRRAAGAASHQQPPTSQMSDGGATLPPGVGATSITTPDIVGREFVRQYYTMMADAPQLVCKFYSNESVYVFNGQEPVVGPHLVGQSIESLQITECHTKIRAVDAHETFAKAVLVQVIGEISINSYPHRRFAQTFVLAPKSERKYYVYNDTFRYLDGLFDENTIVHDTDALKMQDGTKNLTVNGAMHEDEINNNQHTINMQGYANVDQAQPLPPRSLGANIPPPTINRLVYPEPVPPPAAPASTPVTMPVGQPSGDSGPHHTAGDWMPQSTAAYVVAVPKPSMTTDTKPSTAVTGQKPSLADPKPPRHREETAMASSKPSSVEQQHQQPSSTGKDVADDRPSTTLGDEAPTAVVTSSGVGDNNGMASSWANKVAGRPPTKQQPPFVQPSPPTLAASAGGLSSSGVADVSRESPSSSTAATIPPTSAPSSFANGGGGGGAAGRPFGPGHRGGGGNVGTGKPLNKDLLARQIYVKYLPEDMTEKELHDAFSVFGAISPGGVQISRSKLRPAATFAFITFEEASSADKAVECRAVHMRNNAVHAHSDHRRDEFSSGRRLSSDRSLDRMGGGGGGPPRGGGRGRGGPGGFRGGRGGPGGGGGGGAGGGRTFMARGGHTYYSGGGNYYPAAPHDQPPPATPPIAAHGAALAQSPQQKQ